MCKREREKFLEYKVSSGTKITKLVLDRLRVTASQI